MLASTSPWRRKILENAGFRVLGVPSGVDESLCDVEGAQALAWTLARQKAEVVARQHPGRWVIGADQLVDDGQRVFGKPSESSVARSGSLVWFQNCFLMTL